ncbi:MAG: transglutaminase-like domain-containing protein [bacterium]|nr:transglutaminase-like domain-containing protein [bacterium]
MNIKNNIYTAIKLIIAFLWIIMIFILIRNNYPSKIFNNKFNTVNVDNSLMKDEWMGIYFNKKKIGYSHWMMVPDKDKNMFLINEQSYMSFTAGGENIKMRINNVAVVDPALKLKEFTSYLSTSQYKLKVEGKVAGDRLNIKFISDKSAKYFSIPLKEIPSITSNLNQYILSKGLTVNSNYIFPYYDPFTLSNKNISITVEKKEQIKVYGEMEQAYKIKEDYDGIIIYTWLKEDGTRIREESPMGFILQRERQDDALNILESGDKIDIMKSTSILVEKRIDSPRELKYLKIEISGIKTDGFSLLNRGRQRLNKNTLEVFSLPLKDDKADNPGEYLASSIFIQSDDALIKNKAKEIIGNENDAYKKTELISKWLFQNIKKKITVSVPDAVTILRLKCGDCNEHATLFCALARAVNLPAKICVGLVYSENGFYYHAWNEVFAGGQWISVDSVFDQIPADATHIKFIEGELAQQMDILKIVGQIQIKILEYK